MDVLQQADISFTLMRVTTLFCFDAKNHASKFCSRGLNKTRHEKKKGKN